MIEQTRLLTLHAAHAMDTMGSRAARKQVKHSHQKSHLIEQYVIFSSFCHFQIAMIKVAAARMVCKVIDSAIQVYGGAGVSGDVPLAQM